jgi:DNA-binding CsgD family transcriptional regulator
MIQTLGKIELKVLWLVSQHLSIKQIGEKLFISHHTVNNHQSNIRKKLNINGRSSLLKYALAIKDRFIEANDRVWIKPES